MRNFKKMKLYRNDKFWYYPILFGLIKIKIAERDDKFLNFLYHKFTEINNINEDEIPNLLIIEYNIAMGALISETYVIKNLVVYEWKYYPIKFNSQPRIDTITGQVIIPVEPITFEIEPLCNYEISKMFNFILQKFKKEKLLIKPHKYENTRKSNLSVYRPY